MKKGVSNPRYDKVCVVCDKEFSGTGRSRYCSFECNVFDRAEKKYTGVEGYDYFRCPVCNQKVKEINLKHAKMHGFETPTEFAKFYNLDSTKCQAKRDAMKGENNPAYDHGGKYSKFSKNFIHGYDEEWHMQSNAKMSKFRNENKELFKSNLEYWIKECNGNIEEAKVKYKEFQTRDLEYFIKKYGEEEGTARYKSKTEKWLESMPRMNYSMISQQLFNDLVSAGIDTTNVYFATFDREDKKDYQNKELRIETENSFVMADFVDVAKKKIIEFDGDYWHCESRGNKTRDADRDAALIQLGYEVKHVAERDYKANKESVIQECVQYLNS